MAELIYNTGVGGLSGFALVDGSTNIYTATLSSDAPSIAAGTSYTVIWDGKIYVTEATNGLDGAPYIGNYNTNFDRTDRGTGEPFSYYYNSDGTGSFYTKDASSSHTIAIYNGSLAHTGYLTYKQTIAFNSSDDSLYCSLQSNFVSELSEGKNYTVLWDGEYYHCKAASEEIPVFGETVFLGNKKISTGIEEDDTGEPFLCMFVVSSAFAQMQTLSTEYEHTISIYDGYLRESTYLCFEQTPVIRGNGLASLMGETAVELNNGRTYCVEFNGVPYLVEAFQCQTEAGLCTCVGNANLHFSTYPLTTEPFFLIYDNTCEISYLQFSDTSLTDISLSVYQYPLKRGWLVRDREVKCESVDGLYGNMYMFDQESGEWRTAQFDSSEMVLGDVTEPILREALVPNAPYTVIWDGVPFLIKAGIGEPPLVTMIGDIKYLEGREDFPSGEPFCIITQDMWESGKPIEIMTALGCADSSTHTISIYAGELGAVFENCSVSYTESGCTIFRTKTEPLMPGAEYTIVINDVSYKRTTFQSSYMGVPVIGIGNPAGFVEGEVDNGDPFAFSAINLVKAMMAQDPSSVAMATQMFGLDSSMFVMQWLEGTPLEKYTISLYEGDKPSAGGGSGEIVWADPADVYTYDKDGNPVLHEKRGSVTLDTPDGRYAVFKLSHIADSRN